MWKPIIVVWNKNYARKLKKDRSSGILMYQISEEEKKQKNKKKNYVTFTNFQVVNTLSGKQQATKNHIIKCGMGKR